MLNLFNGDGYYYYIPLILQGICAIHFLRNGTAQKWLWIIIIIPVLGSLAYLYFEVWRGRRINQPKIDVKAIINPHVKYKRLEEKVRFSDTFANRMELADAYLSGGFIDDAIDLYEQSLTGAFAENEHGLQQLMVAYSKSERYAEVVDIGRKLYRTPQFLRAKWHVLYAIALEHTGNIQQAEEEFKMMKGRYSNFEQRYEYALFLERNKRFADAAQILADMLEEQPQLTPMERKANREWFSKANTKLRKLQAENNLA